MLNLEIGLLDCVPHLNTVSDINFVHQQESHTSWHDTTLLTDGSLAEPDCAGSVCLPEEMSY